MTEINYSNLTVLVIDDQAFVRKIVIALLRQIGFRNIYEAVDGAAGLQSYNQVRPDIVLCDIEMQPVDGIVFMQTLRRENTGGDIAPVLFLTSHAESDIVQQARELGVDAFLVKPVSLGALKKRIDFVLTKE